MQLSSAGLKSAVLPSNLQHACGKNESRVRMSRQKPHRVTLTSGTTWPLLASFVYLMNSTASLKSSLFSTPQHWSCNTDEGKDESMLSNRPLEMGPRSEGSS